MMNYITIPMAVLEGWIGQSERYLKWWTWLRREATWNKKTVNGQFTGKAVAGKQAHRDTLPAAIRKRKTH